MACAWWVCDDPTCNGSSNYEMGDHALYGRRGKPCPRCGEPMYLEWDEERDDHSQPLR